MGTAFSSSKSVQKQIFTTITKIVNQTIIKNNQSCRQGIDTTQYVNVCAKNITGVTISQTSDTIFNSNCKLTSTITSDQLASMQNQLKSLMKYGSESGADGWGVLKVSKEVQELTATYSTDLLNSSNISNIMSIAVSVVQQQMSKVGSCDYTESISALNISQVMNTSAQIQSVGEAIISSSVAADAMNKIDAAAEISRKNSLAQIVNTIIVVIAVIVGACIVVGLVMYFTKKQEGAGAGGVTIIENKA